MFKNIHILNTGFCWARGRILAAGQSWAEQKLPVLCIALEDAQGHITLIDTGYTTRFLQITKYFPEKLYALATAVDIQENQSALRQLQGLGFSAKDVKKIVATHFHADHTGGLLDFPDATFFCSERAWLHTKARSGLNAVRKGILKAQIPADFAKRALLLKNQDFSIKLPNLYPFEKWADIFADGSAFAVMLEGHAAGQIGIFIPLLNQKPVFVVSDACWLSISFQKKAYPSSLVRLFIDDYAALKTNIDKIHALFQNYPELCILPLHCAEAWVKSASF